MKYECGATLDWGYKGYRTLILENDKIKVVILLDKGSDIIEFVYKPLNLDVLWHSKFNTKSYPQLGHSLDTSSTAQDVYEGGWTDNLPVAGYMVKPHRGVRWGQLGETGLLPWECNVEKESDDGVSVTLSTECIRYPLKISKNISLKNGESCLSITENIKNVSPVKLEYSWIQRPALGAPFLSPNCRVDLPAGIIENEIWNPPNRWSRLKPGHKSEWPYTLDKNEQLVDLRIVPEKNVDRFEVTYAIMNEGWFAVTNPNIKLSFGMVWDKEVFPYLWFHQCYSYPDYPYFGRAWNLIPEPCTSWPNTFERQIENETIATIEGYETKSTTIRAVLHSGVQVVTNIDSYGRVSGEF